MYYRRDFTRIKALASAKNGGNNCGVFLVKSKRSGTKYIEKQVSKAAIDSEYAKREVIAMLTCEDQPNIVQLLFADLDYFSTGYGSIFMQHCELGSLDGVISQYNRKRDSLRDEGFMYKILWDISLALCFLQTGRKASLTRSRAVDGKGVYPDPNWSMILHRDIKPANIFLTWANSHPADRCPYPTAVLGDFGCSVLEKDVREGRASYSRTSGLTPCFVPPEAPKYHRKGDVYMLAVSVHCLAMMRQTPRSSQWEREKYPLQGYFRCGHLNLLLQACLRENQWDRPDATNLPALVKKAYGKWRRGRRDDGQKLPSWAFG